jgi:4-hydroxy-3-methylbut-2-enyl diphosphate reductase
LPPHRDSNCLQAWNGQEDSPLLTPCVSPCACCWPPRGFCAGVERAIAIVEHAIEAHEAPVYVRHEIVHNARVVRDLEAQGAIFVEELHEVPDGAVTIFSAHGVPASVEAEAEKRGLPVYDATCRWSPRCTITASASRGRAATSC